MRDDTTRGYMTLYRHLPVVYTCGLWVCTISLYINIPVGQHFPNSHRLLLTVSPKTSRAPVHWFPHTLYDSCRLQHVLLDEPAVCESIRRLRTGRTYLIGNSLGASFSLDLQIASSRLSATPLLTCLATNLRSASSSLTSNHHRSSSISAASRQGSMPRNP